MRRPVDPLNGTGLREFGEPPTHAVDSLDTLRKYLGPQDEPPAVVAKAAIDWKARAHQERLYVAHGTFVRFAANLSGLDTPVDTPEAQLRDELLAVLACHGYFNNS